MFKFSKFCKRSDSSYFIELMTPLTTLGHKLSYNSDFDFDLAETSECNSIIKPNMNIDISAI